MRERVHFVGFHYKNILYTFRTNNCSSLGSYFCTRSIQLLHLEHSFIWCWNLDTSGSRSETPGKFWNVVLEKDGENQLDRSCEKWKSIT